MKTLQHILVLTLCFFAIQVNAQTFTDNLANDIVGEAPSKWSVITGTATIDMQDGEKVILLDNQSIIAPEIGYHSYLSDNFTLKFQAYFDDVEKAMSYQFYNIRFWNGNKNYSFNNNKVTPLKLYRYGMYMHLSYPTNTGNKNTQYKEGKLDLEGRSGTWRNITINYNASTLKVTIDRLQIVEIPNIRLTPSMISIEGEYAQASKDYIRAIKNVSISGIKSQPTDEDGLPDNDTNIPIGNYAYTLPKTDGTPGQILRTNGYGTVNWVDFPNGETTSPIDINTDVETIEEVNGIDTRQIGDLNPNDNNVIDEIIKDTISAVGTGLGAIDEGNGIGWRLIGRNPIKYGNIGENAIDLSYAEASNSPYGIYIDESESEKNFGATGQYSVALGWKATASMRSSVAIGCNTTASEIYSTAIGSHTYASGRNSTAIGFQTIASGSSSTAIGDNTGATGPSSTSMGNGTKASGSSSTAMGRGTKASGVFSTSIGNGTTASGNISTAIGESTIALSSTSIAMGKFNIGFGDPTEWNEIDPLLEIGNGSNWNNKHNAFTILKNGNVGIDTYTPQAKLHITDGEDAKMNKGGYVILGNEKDINLVFDNNEIIARNNTQPAPLYLQSDGGDVQVGRAIVHNSDRRLKQDISNLTYGLQEILKLRPVSYLWKTSPDAPLKSMGLIAQDVQPLINEIVRVGTDTDQTLSVSYTELIPVLIKAIQEQQKIIENQNSKIENLTSNLTTKDEALIQLTARVKQIESLLNTEKQ